MRPPGLVALVASVRARRPLLRRIVRESVPVLVLAGTIDIIAGLTIEKRFSSFLVYPALLVLVPPFLEDSGSLGGILSARVSTKLHLGTLEPGRWRLRAVADDVLLVFVYAVPVFLLLGVTADIAAAVVGVEEPGQPGDDRGLDAGGVARDDVRGARRVLRRRRRRTGSASIPTTTGSRSSRRASTSSARSR